MIGHNFKKRHLATQHSRAGFTLLELILAIGILIVAVMAFATLSQRMTTATLRYTGSLLTQQSIQSTLAVMIPEIRAIAQSNDGAYPIAVATTSTLSFYSDLDHNGTFEKVRYFWNGTKLTKGVITPTGSPLSYPTSTEVLTDLVENLAAGTQLFTYYDKNATSTASVPMSSPIDPLKIKTVKVYIVANQGTELNSSLVGVETEATIRNLRYK